LWDLQAEILSLYPPKRSGVFGCPFHRPVLQFLRFTTPSSSSDLITLPNLYSFSYLFIAVMPSKTVTVLTALWAYLHTLQYGFHISALNGLQAPLTCDVAGGAPAGLLSTASWSRRPCVPMSVSHFLALPKYCLSADIVLFRLHTSVSSSRSSPSVDCPERSPRTSLLAASVGYVPSKPLPLPSFSVLSL